MVVGGRSTRKKYRTNPLLPSPYDSTLTRVQNGCSPLTRHPHFPCSPYIRATTYEVTHSGSALIGNVHTVLAPPLLPRLLGCFWYGHWSLDLDDTVHGSVVCSR